MAHSPLFHLFARTLHFAKLANRYQIPVDELPELRQHQLEIVKLRQRKFLKASTAFGMPSFEYNGDFPPISTQKETSVKIAIVGAGIAGLNAAYHLKKAGYYAPIYEATNRVGGRIYTVKDIVGKDMWMNLGGEFINSDHYDMRGLAEEFNIPLLDRFTDEELALNYLYYFDGREISETQLAKTLLPMIERMSIDVDRLYKDWDRVSVELDALSIAEYCDRLGITGWLRKFLDIVIVTDTGLKSEEVTSLNFLWLVSTVDREGNVQLAGNSDERFLVQNGTQSITDAIAWKLQNQIETGMPLEALRDRGDGFTLTFNGTDIDADIVIIAIPFSVLRHVYLDLALPDKLNQFIHQVGYGNNVKLTTGFSGKPWRECGLSGEGMSDLPLQVFWEATQLQSVETGALTFFLGGNMSLSSQNYSDCQNAEMYIKMLDRIIPNLHNTWNKKTTCFDWSSHNYTQGSYTCWHPRQYTGFVRDYLYSEENTEQECAHGNLIFAGEHTSDEYLGYMNGAAQSGRLAAKAVLKRLNTIKSRNNQELSAMRSQGYATF